MTYNCENILVNVYFGKFAYFLPRKNVKHSKTLCSFQFFVEICVTIIVRKCYALYVFAMRFRYIIQHDN